MVKPFIIIILLLSQCFTLRAVECWRVEEISFTSTVSYPKPFTDCSLSVKFTGPSGQVIIRPAFWDGNNTWKVRFAPTVIGSWHYTSSANDLKNKGLHNKKGKIECTSYKGNQEIYKHGFIRISNNKRHLSYFDGTPFLWMSDEHVFADTERWDSCNLEGCKSQFKYIADLRKSQKFNVYNTVIWLEKEFKNIGTEPKLEYYQMMDLKMNYLADSGYVISYGLGYHANLGDSLPDIAKINETKLLARYVEARYGAYPLIYYTCGEFNIPVKGKFDFKDLFNRYWWGDIAKEIENHNSYDHPVSINYWTPQGTWFSKESYFDYWSLQAYRLPDFKYYKYWYNNTLTKPIIDAASGMDHNTESSQDEQRKLAYLIIQSGGAGWGHLTEGVWNNCWKENECGCCVNQWGGRPWNQTISNAGADNMRHAYNFYTSFEWYKQVPRFEDTTWANFANSEQSVISTNGNKLYVVYFYSADSSTGFLKNMDDQSVYTGSWYDTRTGKYHLISNNIKSSLGHWTIPTRPDSSDWILIVKSNP